MPLTSSLPFFSEILILRRGHRAEITWIEKEGSLDSNTLLSEMLPHRKHVLRQLLWHVLEGACSSRQVRVNKRPEGELTQRLLVSW